MIDIRDKLGKLCGAVQSCAVLSMLITLLQHWSTAWISLCSTIGAVLSVCNFSSAELCYLLCNFSSAVLCCVIGIESHCYSSGALLGSHCAPPSELCYLSVICVTLALQSCVICV